jgi:hypothetical protein
VKHLLFKGHLRVTASLRRTSSSAKVTLELYALEIASLFGFPPPEFKSRRPRHALGQARARLATRGAKQHLQAVRRRLQRSSLMVGGIQLSVR